MEKTLELLSASDLRRLLIEEIHDFIMCLEDSPTEELVERKLRLREILDLLTEKEKIEMAPILWGKNTRKLVEKILRSE